MGRIGIMGWPGSLKVQTRVGVTLRVVVCLVKINLFLWPIVPMGNTIFHCCWMTVDAVCGIPCSNQCFCIGMLAFSRASISR